MKKIILLILAAALLGGCKKDDGVAPGGDGTMATFTLNPGSFDLEETKLTTVQENTMANVAVLQFNTAGAFVKYTYVAGAVAGNKLNVALTSGSKQTVVFVANVADAAPLKTFTGTLAQFRALTAAMANEAALTTGNVLVMSGEYAGDVIGGKTLAAVTMKRAAAKILFTYCVDIPNAVETKQSFVLKSVQLFNVPQVMAYGEPAAGTNYPATTVAYGNYPAIPVATTPTATAPATQTWYMADNRRGTGTASAASQKTKEALGEDGEKATYVELKGDYTTNGQTVGLTYTLYLGADPVKDYNIRRNTIYKVMATIKGANVVDMRISVTTAGSLGVDDVPVEDVPGGDAVMGAIQPANCYMVNPKATDVDLLIPVRRVNEVYQDKVCDLYGLQNVQGYQQRDSIPALADGRSWTAEVLWQDKNVNMITFSQATVTKRDDYIKLRTVAGCVPGNVVIGLRRNSDKKLVWSWHLWITPYEPAGGHIGDMEVGKMHQYAGWMEQNNKTIMDRNLGAEDNTKDDKSWGLLYQWGRKDPFIGAVSGGTNQTKAWYVPNGSGGWTACTEGDVIKTPIVAELNNIYNAVMNPMAFYPSDAEPYDWTAPQNDNLWRDAVKTLFDPCPSGWRVPRGVIWTNMTTANTIWQTTEKGRLVWDIVKGGPAWYPAVGFRDAGKEGQPGNLINVGNSGSSWSSSINATGAVRLGFTSTWFDQNSASDRATGLPLRCVQE